MKIRNGFVSNSSSSSFVIAFPKNFDVDKTLNKFFKRHVYDQEIVDGFTEFVKHVINNGGFWEDEYRHQYYEDYDTSNVDIFIGTFMKECAIIISETDTSSESGQTTIVRLEEIFEKWNKNED